MKYILILLLLLATLSKSYTQITEVIVKAEKCVFTSVDDIEESTLESKLNIYPNPATDNMIYVGLSGLVIDRITVYDYKGTQVKSSAPGKPSAELDISDLSPGSYIFQVDTGTSIVNRKVLVK